MLKKYFLAVIIFIMVLIPGVSYGNETNVNIKENDIELNEIIDKIDSKEFRWNLGEDPSTIDPQRNSRLSGGTIINNLYEGLMREIDNEIVPAMAKEYELSEDKKVYTFIIRDALWSDNKEVTAYDFEYAWKRALNFKLEPYPCEMYYLMDCIKGATDAYEGKISLDEVGIEALDEKVLRVELNEPTPYFLKLTTMYTFMPVRQDIVELNPVNWDNDTKNLVFNGPFILKEHVPWEKYVFEKNINYWNAEKVKLDKLEGVIIPDNYMSLLSYENKDIDLIESKIPINQITHLKKNKSFKLYPQCGVYYYLFNTNKKPLNDPRVRKALSISINREEIIKNLLNDKYIPATGVIPPSIIDTLGNIFREKAGDYGIGINKANVEEAKRLLKEAGYDSAKETLELEIAYNNHYTHEMIAQIIKSMWENNLGIKVTLKSLSWSESQEYRNHGDFIISRAGWIADYPDPEALLKLWTSQSKDNVGKWENDKYDELINQSKLYDGKKRDELLYDAEKILMNDMAIMPIYYYTTTAMERRNLDNIHRSGFGFYFFGYMDIKENTF